jgi:histidine triad (HIT) family protein
MVMSDCIFCKIAAKQIPSKLVYESVRLVAFRDIAPKAPFHILIVPREHLATVNDFTPAHKDLIGEMTLVAASLASKEGIANRGYRLLFNCNAEAGQVVFHVHLHLMGGWGRREGMDM